MVCNFETDYLVVGAGAAGMAFADALLSHSDATLTIVDQRHTPGGHWVDAYPFVRLHQPSAFYGVSSVPLGDDAKDRSGLNAGYYGLASADELRAYYAQVMQQHFIPSGRVRYLPCSDWLGGEAGRHRIRSRVSGITQECLVRRKLVDTSYVGGAIPATSPPPFEVAHGVRCVPAGDVARLVDHAGRFVVIGAGKTALDVCVWLLTQGVPASAIQWVKPREGWWLNRRFHQPHSLLPEFYAGVGLQLQAIAQATSVDEVFLQLEADGFFLRVDPTVMPTMSHGAIVSEAELALLRQITDVVRMGHVRRIDHQRMVLDQGEVPAHEDSVYVHCAAAGVGLSDPRPIFAGDRLTVQPLFWSFACFPFAIQGVVEATLDSDEEKNRLCPPIRYWDTPADYLSTYRAAMLHARARAAYPVLNNWVNQSRLNPLRDLGQHRDHPQVVHAREVTKAFAAAAAANVEKLLGR